MCPWGVMAAHVKLVSRPLVVTIPSPNAARVYTQNGAVPVRRQSPCWGRQAAAQ